MPDDLAKGVTRVFVLFQGAYSDRDCTGVYSTLEKAQAVAEKLSSRKIVKWEGNDEAGRWDSVSNDGYWMGGFDICTYALDDEGD